MLDTRPTRGQSRVSITEIRRMDDKNKLSPMSYVLRGAPLLACSIALALSAHAGPTGGEITHGDGNIGRAGGNTTIINQLTDRISIDWETFNVAANERVVFQQPNSRSTALNRILDQNPSQIFGAIDANGRILLINPNGFLFGRTASVNVQSLVASSLNLSTDDFKAGRYDLAALAESHGSAIINRGHIEAAAGGSISLIADQVVNEGVIMAHYGQVNLASGRQAAIDFDGDGMLLFAIDGPVTDNPGEADAAVTNTGHVLANGGQILLAANAAERVFDSVVNNQGVLRATRVENSGGVIQLLGEGGTVRHSGVIDASSADGRGGQVDLTGDRVGLFGDASIDASGATGGGRVRIGGGLQGNDTTIANAERTLIGGNASVNADAVDHGDGGEIYVWSERSTQVFGDLSARGGEQGGSGGFVETSGKIGLSVMQAPDVGASRGQAGEWLIDPTNIAIDAGPGSTDITTNPTPQDFVPDGTPDDATIGVDVIVAALTGGATVTITTASGGGGAGNITMADGVTLDYNGTGAGTLILNADGNIVLDGNISDSVAGGDSLNLELNAPTGDVIIDSNGFISLASGTFDVDSITFTNNGDVSGTGAMTFELDTDFANAAAATLDAGAANLMINAGFAGGGGTVSLDGTITGGTVTVNGSLGAEIVSILSDITATIQTGDGNDQITIDAIVTGTVDAGLANDTITLLDGASVSVSLTGGGGTDTLVGTAAADAFVVNGANAGTLNAQAFTGIESVDGAGGNDSFDLAAGGSLTGTAQGGAGDDDFSLNGGTANLIDGGESAGDDDSITATAGNDIFTVSTEDTGTVGAQGFANVETLDGQGGDDTFNLNATLNGSAIGGADSDDFILGTGGSADQYLGDTGTNTITASNASNVWVLNADDGGTLNGSVFDGIATITGGSLNDAFTITAAFLGTVFGGDGNDAFSLATGAGVAGGIDGEGGTDTLVGRPGANTFTLTQANGGTLS